MNKLRYAILIILVSFIYLNANSVILTNLTSYIVSKDINITSLDDNNLYKNSQNRFKIGNNKPLMIKLELFNRLNQNSKKVITFNSALIEELKIYEIGKNKKSLIKDLSLNKRAYNTIYPYFKINLEPKSKKVYYIYANSKYISTYFNIEIKDEDKFLKNSSQEIIYFSILVGIFTAMFVTFIILYLFNNRYSYLYFGLFILFELLILFYFSGIESIIVTSKFLMLDKTLIAIKFNLAFIAISLFAIYYFSINKDDSLFKAYIYLIYIAVIEIIASGFINMYYLIIPIMLYLPIVNISTGIKYIKTTKGSMLFILANTLFLINISIYLVNTFLDKYIKNHNASLIFILANLSFALMFVFRYYFNKLEQKELIGSALDQKLKLDSKIKNLQNQLKELEDSKNSFKKSMNDIIKNNLKMVLSMLKMQNNSYSFETAKEIAKLNKKLSIYTKIYALAQSNSNPKDIDLKEFLPKVIDFIKLEYHDANKSINIKSTINATTTLNEALDISLTVANILISSYEDSSTLDDSIEIVINMVDGKYNLAIKDLNSNPNSIFTRLKSLFS